MTNNNDDDDDDDYHDTSLLSLRAIVKLHRVSKNCASVIF